MTIRNGGDEKPKPKILIRPRVPGTVKPEPDRIPNDAETRLEKKSDHAMRPTIKPPRPHQQDQQPVSVRTGNSDGPITGTENTVAAPSVSGAPPAQAAPEAARAPSRRPPPPPPTFKITLQNVSAACDQLMKDERLDERAKANALAKLYDGQFRIDADNPKIRALESGAKRHGEELDRLVRSLGNDKQKLMKAQESARAKWEQGGAGMDEQGYKIIELLYTKMAIEALSSDGTDSAEQKSEKENKLARFDDYIKKKLGATGTLKPLEDYLFGLLKLRSAAEKAAKDADEYDRINSMKRSRRYSQRVDGDKSPGRGIEKPPKPPAVVVDEPAFVENPEGKRLSAPPEPEKKSNRPPASAMYRNQPEPGFVRRMFTDPMFWTVSGLSAFTSALIYKDSFREMANALRMLWRDTLHRPDFEFTKLHMIIGYAGVMALGIGLSVLLRRREVRKKALKYQELSEGSRKEREKKDRVISKLTRISLEHDKFEDQITQLRQALLQDAQFMSDLYELKKHKFFNEMLAEARVHPKLVQNLNIIFERVKIEKLQKRLNKLADLLDQPEQRCGLFKEHCLNDPIFAMMIHEIFERRGGNYVNIDKQNAAFHEVLNEKDENVGPQLLKALKDDFESFRDEV